MSPGSVAMTIVPKDAPLGAEVRGVDLRQPLSPGDHRKLVDALYCHHLLIFRGQDLEPGIFERFAALWGELYVETYDNMCLTGHPAIMQVGNVGPLLAKEQFRNGASFWHTDRAYATDCNAVTLLYSVIAPAQGGETHFANMALAYEALAPETKAEINPLMASHRYGGGDREAWEWAVHPMSQDQEAQLPPAGRHLLARPHSVTGRKGLYGIAGSAFALEGPDGRLGREAQERICRKLKKHAISEHFVTRHRYAKGDLVLWDNTATLHYASPIGAAMDAASSRLLYRIVATGLPPILSS